MENFNIEDFLRLFSGSSYLSAMQERKKFVNIFNGFFCFA